MGDIVLPNERQSIIRCEFNGTDSEYHNAALCDGRMSKVLMVVMLVMGFVTFFVNLGVLIRTIKILKHTHDPKPAFYFIGNLAVSDLAIGLYVIISFLLHLGSGKLIWGNESCLLQIGFAVTCCQATIFTILLIAVDKYIFITYCFKYRDIVTTKRVCAAITVTWILSLFIGLLPALGMSEDEWCGVCALARVVSTGYTVLLLLTAVVGPYGVVVTLYSILLILALKMQKARHGGSFSANAKRVLSHRLSLISKKSTKSTISKKSTKSTISKKSNKSTISSRSRNTLKKNKANADVPSNEAEAEIPALEACGDRPRSHTADTHWGEVSGDRPRSQTTDTQTTFLSLQTENNLDHINEDIICDEHDIDNETDKMFIEVNLETTINSNNLDSGGITDEEAGIHKEGDVLIGKENVNGYLEPQRILDSQENITAENIQNIDAVPFWKTWNPSAYINRFATETKDKVLFLKRCQAVKTVFLIIGSFTVTYVPFVVGSLVYSLQTDLNKDQCLLHALNTLMYIAIVSNSLANPFIYAYGYKEFRMKTKKFKGIFARERKPKI